MVVPMVDQMALWWALLWAAKLDEHLVEWSEKQMEYVKAEKTDSK